MKRRREGGDWCRRGYRLLGEGRSQRQTRKGGLGGRRSLGGLRVLKGLRGLRGLELRWRSWVGVEWEGCVLLCCC